MIDIRDEDVALGLVPLSENLDRRYRFPGPLRQRLNELIYGGVQWATLRLVQGCQSAVRSGEDSMFLV